MIGSEGLVNEEALQVAIANFVTARWTASKFRMIIEIYEREKKLLENNTSKIQEGSDAST